MMPDDSERDPVLHRHLVLLRRHEPTSPAFTDRVVRDLAHRGLVRRSPATRDVRWLAAAAVLFALGIGVGTIVTTRRSPTTVPSTTREPIARVAVEINVPPPGKSEVWF
jgi:hypothetical protein